MTFQRDALNHPPQKSALDLSRIMFAQDDLDTFIQARDVTYDLQVINEAAERAKLHINWFFSGMVASGNAKAQASLNIAIEILRQQSIIHASATAAMHAGGDRLKSFQDGISACQAFWLDETLDVIHTEYGKVTVSREAGDPIAIHCDGEPMTGRAN